MPYWFPPIKRYDKEATWVPEFGMPAMFGDRFICSSCARAEPRHFECYRENWQTFAVPLPLPDECPSCHLPMHQPSENDL